MKKRVQSVTVKVNVLETEYHITCRPEETNMWTGFVYNTGTSLMNLMGLKGQ
jgi:hypothetical protein